MLLRQSTDVIKDTQSNMLCCMMTGRGIPEDCIDKPWYANCELIIEANMCRHPYFSDFCCRSCHQAGRLPWTHLSL